MNPPALTRYAAPDFLALALPRREAILEPILANRSAALLYGPRGIGKTFFALALASAAAAGGSFLGWRAPRPFKVLYVDGEMTGAEMQQRLAALGPPPPRLELLLSDLHGGPLLDLGHAEGLETLMTSWGTPELVVLDNLSTLTGLRSGDVDRWHVLQQFLMQQKRLGRAVLMLHHANKKGVQRGISRREDMLDLVMAMRRPAGWQPRDGARFELHFEKARSLRGGVLDPLAVQLEPAGDAVRWHWQPARDERLDRAVALLAGGLPPEQVAAALGVSRALAFRLQRQARQSGRLTDPRRPAPAGLSPPNERSVP
jgi:putative DNA primase/helicase